MKSPGVSRSAQALQDVESMDAVPLDALDFPQLRPGDIVDGHIISISPTQILVDIGYKADAVVDSRELDRLDPEFLASLAVGDPIMAYVLQPEDRDGNVVISLAKAQQEQDWRLAEELFASQEIFEGVVTGYNRGGVIVRVGRVRGFVPASQLSSHWQARQDTEADPEERWAGLVGEKLQLKVLELDRQRNRLILSERVALRDWRRDRKERLLSELKKGDVLQGVITSLTDFGAFVDLGGADGLIHLSELSWHRVDHPSEVVHVGQKVEVYVLNVDEERKRIALSLRKMLPEPWSLITEKYAVGQVVSATITRLANFGAFARIEEGIEGLIHITELADHRVNHPKEVVREGDQVQVRIIHMDAQRRRLGLSMRQVAEESYIDIEWREEAKEELKQGEAEQPVDKHEVILAALEPQS